jgi:hypothetical protein
MLIPLSLLLELDVVLWISAKTLSVAASELIIRKI